MKKHFTLFAAAMAIAFASFSQPMATESKVEFQKSDKVAAMIELPYPPEVVEDAIKESLARKGIKPDKSKDFMAYRGARLTETDSEYTDLFFKVERKSRKEKATSMIYLVTGKPNENLSLKTSGDNYKLAEAKTFLNDLVPEIEAHNLEVIIAEQDEVIKKAEKKLRNYEDDQKDLETKIRNLEDKLSRNKKDQEDQNVSVNKERAVRDAMISRRKDK